jgi:hypothetical protein
VLAGLAVLTQIDVGSSRVTVGVALSVLGLGMGISLQPYLLAGQNAVAAADVGVATSSMQFARSMGGSLAVAALGTLLTNRLTGRLAADADVTRLLQGGRVPAGARGPLAASLAEVFLAAGAVAIAGIVLALLLEEHPLRER